MSNTIADYETERLGVRHWGASLADAEARAALERDLTPILTPRVLAHLPPSLQIGPDSNLRQWVDDRAGESDVLTIRHRETGVLMGVLILAQPFDAGQVHIGYLLAETAWGAGYATELVKGLIAAVSEGTELVGGVGMDNPASGRVLQKAGFTKRAALSTPDSDVFVWP
jgi:ribosomal-protein-alanine N-acetyltransferase